MDDKQAKALRAPFPASAIGKLPKGGVQLDYVGHAATTDRLLSVDPTWSWEPMAVDPAGLPILDNGGNLWIRLTVCGVTRIGVGDGKSAKECIGDAIRNAAMRFGVALDLWAKEDLHEISQAVDEPAPKKKAARKATEPPPDTGEAMTDKTRATMFALFNDLEIRDKDVQLAGIGLAIGRQIESRGDLTEAEAQVVLKALREKKAAREA